MLFIEKDQRALIELVLPYLVKKRWDAERLLCTQDGKEILISPRRFHHIRAADATGRDIAHRIILLQKRLRKNPYNKCGLELVELLPKRKIYKTQLEVRRLRERVSSLLARGAHMID